MSQTIDIKTHVVNNASKPLNKIRWETMLFELETNKEDLEEHEQKFVESVTEFFYEKGFITKDQEKYLKIYINKLKELTSDE